MKQRETTMNNVTAENDDGKRAAKEKNRRNA